ncbi:dynein light chain 1, cytoplasmic-like [Zingiber officinale]|uniref:dynein light chain 1, cytoplasmic-like n=1 Tax=Zingiber officinale TaxID=94328 RepID=UPI001C4B0DE0|nr:dynein light chain 1, cytoplasmic-like [Zingiber officinale]
MADDSKCGEIGNEGAAAQKPNVVLKAVDMDDEMRSHAVACARAAFQEHAVEKNIAEHIKKEFDARYGQSWHCIVGRNFGSFVTHESKHFIYLYVDSKAVLLFKSG